MANIKLPPRHARTARAPPQGGLDPREAILGVAEIHFIEAGLCIGICVVSIVGDRPFRLRDRQAPLARCVVEQTLRVMSLRSVGLKTQGTIDRFLGAREVARSVIAEITVRTPCQGIIKAEHSGHILSLESERPLEQRYGVLKSGLTGI